MFSLLIGQMCLGQEQRNQIQEESALFWATAEHGKFMLISQLTVSP